MRFGHMVSITCCLTLFLFGCGAHSLKVMGEQTIGHHFSYISDIRSIDVIEDKSYQLENGNMVYAVDECAENEYNRPTPEYDCMIYFEVDSKGIIVNATAIFEGSSDGSPIQVGGQPPNGIKPR